MERVGRIMTDYKHLTVIEELGKEIRECDGRNDSERIKNWADKKTSKNLKESLKDFIREEISKIEINQRTGELEY